MYTILNLFGRSPFAPLRTHMEKVGMCVDKLQDLFNAIERKDFAAAEQIATQISDHEHAADIMKNDIRNHLPKSLFLPIDRGQLLEILSVQDGIADKAQDVAVLATLKQIELPSIMQADFKAFLDKNIETYHLMQRIIQEMHELLESSFGGGEAEKVKAMAELVSIKEHEADIIQRRLLKHFFAEEQQFSYSTFYLWQKICEAIGSISNLSEKLANRIRMTLDLK